MVSPTSAGRVIPRGRASVFLTIYVNANKLSQKDRYLVCSWSWKRKMVVTGLAALRSPLSSVKCVSRVPSTPFMMVDPSRIIHVITELESATWVRSHIEVNPDAAASATSCLMVQLTRISNKHTVASSTCDSSLALLLLDSFYSISFQGPAAVL